MSYDNTEIRELLDHVELMDFLDREGFDYKEERGSSGVQLHIKTCPFCGGDTWKVYANAQSGLGNCFSGSCEKRFNIYSFIRATLPKSNHANVMQYLKQMASETGWRAKRVQIVAVEDNDELELPISTELPKNDKNLLYLSARNISHEITRYFRLRYSKDGFYAYTGIDGNRRYQNYEKRVIIPIYDLDGKMVSFQGRDITGESEKKYLFPPGKASTGKYLYNGFNAWNMPTIVLNEGVFDVFATKMALDEIVYMRHITPVGTFGKHLSEDQVGELLRLKTGGLKEVIFMWDSEKLAIKAAIESALKLTSLGFVAKVAILPPGCDPNSTLPSNVRKAVEFATLIDKMSATKLLLRNN